MPKNLTFTGVQMILHNFYLFTKTNRKLILKQHLLPSGVVLSLLLLLVLVVACTFADTEGLLENEFKKFSHPSAVQIYWHSYSFSGATGDCAGRATNWWYGTNEMKEQELEEFYEELLTENDYEIWPEDVVEIWRKRDEKGIFSFSTDIFTDKDEIITSQAYYKLPEDTLEQFSNYQVVYLISLSYLTTPEANECFQK